MYSGSCRFSVRWMSKQTTTIRLDKTLYNTTLREARKAGLSFSGVVHLLLLAFTKGDVGIRVVQYPGKYMKMLEKESAQLSRSYKKSKAKGYTSSAEMLGDILGA